MLAYDQDLLDMVFSDLDYLLDRGSGDREGGAGTCVACHRDGLLYEGPSSSHPGASVCNACGVVQPGPVIFEHMCGRRVNTRSSNYKRIHHWHERVSQLLLTESQIPGEHMLLIAERLCDGTHTVICKDAIRAVLRSLGMQIYIEKWLQIIHRVTGVCPPAPGARLLIELDSMFMQLQRPFDKHAHAKRKNFLNYNYVFCRLLQMLGCSQFCMFFPLIKSKQKLKALDEMWAGMAESLKWEVTPLQQVAQFAVRLPRPAAALERIRLSVASTGSAGPQKEQVRMVFQTLDRRHLERLLQRQEQLHCSPSAPSARQTSPVVKRRRRTLASVHR